MKLHYALCWHVSAAEVPRGMALWTKTRAIRIARELSATVTRCDCSLHTQGYCSTVAAWLSGR
jgi:hypothetical protein